MFGPLCIGGLLTTHDRSAFMRLWRYASAALSRTLRHLYEGKRVVCLYIALMYNIGAAGWKLAVLALHVGPEQAQDKSFAQA